MKIPMQINKSIALTCAIIYSQCRLQISVTAIEREDQHQTVVTPTSFFSSPSNNRKIDVEDTTCNVGQVEEANDAQLYLILKELRKTTFFRTFAIDLDQGCPLTGAWKKKKKEDAKPKPDKKTIPAKEEEKVSDMGEVEEDVKCASEGLPDFEENLFGGGSACSLASDTEEEKTPFDLSSGETTNSNVYNEENSNSPSNEEEEEEENDYNNDFDDDFECGNEENEELDPDAEPLCSVESYSISSSLSPVKELFSSALHTLSQQLKWDSESQRRTFSWFKPSNPVIIQNQNDENIGTDCDNDDASIPDTFWMDICSEIKAGDGLQLVNLELNPERNTGYNGTHIWEAIYTENCLLIDGHDIEHIEDDMCYEERVLYRLLSGLHTSTSLSIATHYYPPSKRKNRVNWEPNPSYFYKKFGSHPDYIRNLHFSYLVLLRALRKASKFLYGYEIKTGDIVEDEKATVLLKRLLDTQILNSCSEVFSAFDESLMFQEKPNQNTFSSSNKKITETVALRQNFKGVFHNISSILDCVQCQQCKLHGKMAMLGYGTALKILFSKPNMINSNLIDRNEIVAFLNTIAKFSESLKEVRMLTSLYWESEELLGNNPQKQKLTSESSAFTPSTTPYHSQGDATINEYDLHEKAIEIISQLAEKNVMTIDQEMTLIQLALEQDRNMLLLIKYYHSDLNKLWLHLQNSILKQKIEKKKEPDAIVVGGGLAGLVTSVQILDRGGKVVIIDKEHTVGGNSAKASSGVNGCCLDQDMLYEDSLELFLNDTIKSAGSSAQLALIQTLVKNSARALAYLSERIGIDLSLVAQLGGHSKKRTHRPKNGMVGAEVIYGMQKVVKQYVKQNKATLLVDSKVIQLLTDSQDKKVIGVQYQNLKTNEILNITAPNVILATGGFASDRTQHSYLHEYRPEYMNIPATAGNFSTGDGIKLATTNELQAKTIDMKHVQIHPTGWIDPAEPLSGSKILAGELLRGVGGILLNTQGKRFSNEVGTRAYVAEQMLKQSSPIYNKTQTWNETFSLQSFFLLLSSDAAKDAKKHVDLYTHKGLMTKIHGISDLASFLNVSKEVICDTLVKYEKDASMGVDEFGKTVFRNIPTCFTNSHESNEEMVFHVGKVTPVLHYCMGGLSITPSGQVLDMQSSIIKNLYAVGEVSGGVHGVNRLGGNSLLECTVFGMIVGENIPISTMDYMVHSELIGTSTTTETKSISSNEIPEITMEELSKHNKEDDCWVAIHGKIYNLTEFAIEHPPGPESIYQVSGMDGTDAFDAVHNLGLLDDFDDVVVGTITR